MKKSLKNPLDKITSYWENTETGATQKTILKSQRLILPIKKGWFDLIKSGEKDQEYREIKSFYIKKFIKCSINLGIYDMSKMENIEKVKLDLRYNPINYDFIEFRNGYGKNVPSIMVECENIEIGIGLYVLGAPNYPVFIIKLGRVLN